MVTGSAVVTVVPDGSKFSSFSPLFGPPVATVGKPGALFSYDALPSLPAAEKYATPCACTASIAWATMPSWKNGSSK